MTTEENALRQLRIDELYTRIKLRRFGFREMKRTLFTTAIYGFVVLLSSQIDHNPFSGILIYLGVLVVLFSIIEEHDSHMKVHLADVTELIDLKTKTQNETQSA